jgi:hypothetical protein
METTDRLDRLIPWAMVLTILAVAVFAFVQSYTHVYYLGRTHHETGASLRMLPLSVDWLMFAAGLTRLHLLRKGNRHWMPLAGLALGAIATLIANIAAGIIWGWQTAAINAWAPVVLFVTVELGMLLVRTAKAKAQPDHRTINERREQDGLPPLVGGDGTPGEIIKFNGALTPRQAAEIKRELEAKGFNGNGYQPETQLSTPQSAPVIIEPKFGRPLEPKDTELSQPQPAPEPSPETAAMPKAVDTAPDALQGWGQLGAPQGAGLNGIGLRQGRK